MSELSDVLFHTLTRNIQLDVKTNFTHKKQKKLSQTKKINVSAVIETTVMVVLL